MIQITYARAIFGLTCAIARISGASDETEFYL